VIEPGPLLRVREVRARYGLGDRRAARAVMEQAGAFLVAGRLVVGIARLEAWELRQERCPQHAPAQLSGGMGPLTRPI
jgi:hypothetical protein